ncbi:MAG: tetratricopeptide repeat protein [Pirellulaceae bacterium]
MRNKKSPKLNNLCWTVALVSVLGCGVQPHEHGKVGLEFEAARSLVINGKFAEATQRLTQFIKDHPEHHLAPRATFLLGKSALGSGDLEAAETWFSKTTERFPDSEEAHKAKFKLALVSLLRQNEDDARARFEALAADADGPYTPEATALARFLAQREARDHP